MLIRHHLPNAALGLLIWSVKAIHQLPWCVLAGHDPAWLDAGRVCIRPGCGKHLG